MPDTDGALQGNEITSPMRYGFVAAGSCAAILGVVIAVWPQRTIESAAVLFGAYLGVAGVAQIAVAAVARFAAALRIQVVMSGVLSIGFAVLCLRGGNSALLLALWIGFGWAVRGITQATVAVWVDAMPRAGWYELLGLLILVAGIAVVVVPFASLEVLALVVGGCLLAMGMVEILVAEVGGRAARVAELV